MTLVLPQLPGIAWPIDMEFGNFDTSIQVSLSGKEVRYPNRTQARYRRTLTIDGLDSAGYFPGLVANSLQTLSGFYNQCLGAALMFQYWAPEDNFANAQQFFVGDGATTAFQLVRARGGWIDNVFAPFTPTGLTLIPSSSAPTNPLANVYAPNNLILDSANASLYSPVALTDLGSQSDPFGGSTGVLLTETATTAAHYDQFNFVGVPNIPTVFSIYVKQSGSLQYTSFFIDRQTGGSAGAQITMDLLNGVITQATKFGAASGMTTGVTNAGGGWFRFWISITLDPSTTAYRCGLIGSNNSPTPTTYPNYLGSVSNSYLFAGAQVEVSAAGAPSAIYYPTLATLYYGAPSITVGGSYVDPSAYTISANGVVTFTSPPPPGAAGVWTGNFSWWANWDDDKLSLSHLMSGLWEGKKLSFTTRVL